jgi:hypothetical protein
VSDCSLRELDARARTAYDCFGLVDQGVHYMSKSRFGSGALRTAAIAGVFCAVGALAAGSADAVVTQAVNVTTFHYDNYRTGWDQAETVLTPKAVQKGAGGLTFQMTSFTALDDQVDAQPLVMTGQTIKGQGVHNVVYVVTESNTVYAIDATSGAILLQRTFGAPVPEGSLPGGCSNNGPNVGMTSTPVIDAPNSTMYVMEFYLFNGTTPAYRLHALDLSSLKDIVPAQGVKATATLSNGKPYKFNASVTRQRPALLLANGNVYAGFGSFCDVAANQSRGWVLGWQTGSLTPLPSNELTNKLAKSTDDFFLSSVWMSGYGLASGGPNGDIYFVTGNADYSGDSVNGTTNIGESVVQMSPDLSTVVSIYTPADWSQLDNYDADYGSGGALLLPPQPNQKSDLLVAAGKEGKMFFLNADNLTDEIGSYYIGGCWCGQSYFTGSDGAGHIVTSGNNNAGIWTVKAGAKPGLTNITFANGIPGVQDPGFMTAVSTNGTTANSGVIWSVSHADGSSNEYVWLTAFNANSGAQLFSAEAGTWPNTNGNANLAPVVANGNVYVASYEGLAIFGLAAPTAGTVKVPVMPHAVTRVALAPGQHEIFGRVHGISGSIVTVQKRDGTLVTVDALSAAKKFDLAAPSIGHGIHVVGTYSPAGVMVAAVVTHAKDHSELWLSDR